MPGHPDFQAFPQWIGDPLVSNAALAIGAGLHTDLGINLSNYASVIVAVKPTGGGITATLKQMIHNGPGALVVSTQWTIASGVTTFEQIILQGSIVELDLQGDTPGETVAYALYGSNTATNAQVSSVNVVNFLHNGILVKAEPGLDLDDATAVGNPSHAPITWTATDNAGTSVSYRPVFALGVQHNDAGQVNEAILDLEDAASVGNPAASPLTFALTDDAANARVKVTPTVKVGVQRNDAGQVNEPIIDLEDANGLVWAIADDAANSRVKVTPSFGFGVWTKVADSGVLGGSAANIDFSALPSGFMSFRVLYVGRSSAAAITVQLGLQLNGDTGLNYFDESFLVNGTTLTLNEQANAASISAGVLIAANVAAGIPGAGEIFIVNASDTTFDKIVRGIGYAPGAAAAANQNTADAGGLWTSAAAVNRITLTPRTGSWIAGSRAVVYGC